MHSRRREATGRSASLGASGGGRFARGVQAAAIVTGAGLVVLHLCQLGLALAAAEALPAALGLALGVLAADALTGAVHWACDTWGDERLPWIGASVIRSFHEHHRAPRDMLGSDWIDVNGQPAVAACLVLAVLALPPLAGRLGEHPLLHAFLVALAGTGALANQLHQWAHTTTPPCWVRRLQRGGWILSPARHAPHHRPPHTSHYCISGGWLNRPLDALGFWRALERAITRLTGTRPRAGSDAAGGPAPSTR